MDAAGRRRSAAAAGPRTQRVSHGRPAGGRTSPRRSSGSARSLSLRKHSSAALWLVPSYQRMRRSDLEFWVDTWRDLPVLLQRQKNTFSCIVMQVIWCLKFCNMTKSGRTIPPLQILGGGTCTPVPRDLHPCLSVGYHKQLHVNKYKHYFKHMVYRNIIRKKR